MAVRAAFGSAIVLPSTGFWGVWQRHVDVARSRFLSQAVMPAVEPLITFLVLGYGLGRFVELEGGGDYVKFIAPGMVAVFPMWQAVFACTWEAWFRMENQRTYHAIISTPLGPEDVAAGEIAWGTTHSFLSAIYVMVMAVAFGTVDSPLAVLVLPVAILNGVMLSALSLWYTASVSSSHALGYFFTMGALPMFWLGNVFFPASSLPQALQTLGWFVPTTHTVAIYRALFTGDLAWSQLGDLAWLAVVGAFCFLMATRALRRRLLV